MRTKQGYVVFNKQAQETYSNLKPDELKEFMKDLQELISDTWDYMQQNREDAGEHKICQQLGKRYFRLVVTVIFEPGKERLVMVDIFKEISLNELIDFGIKDREDGGINFLNHKKIKHGTEK